MRLKTQEVTTDLSVGIQRDSGGQISDTHSPTFPSFPKTKESLIPDGFTPKVDVLVWLLFGEEKTMLSQIKHLQFLCTRKNKWRKIKQDTRVCLCWLVYWWVS